MAVFLSAFFQIRYSKLAVPTDQGVRLTNHMFFVDDLKIFATDQDNIKSMPKEVERLLVVVKLEVNSAKSATITQ
ncbi:unnamed protein product, partial [Thelazia callipaeda]|uniref:Reverse transcriptase domain-containing protein n=1 Tax=Thelazia callipaeda TaxID=103827 RepID=A0A0N5CTL1_THECL